MATDLSDLLQRLFQWMVLLFFLAIIRLIWVMSSSKPLDDLDVAAPIFSAGAAFRESGPTSKSFSDVQDVSFPQPVTAALFRGPGPYEQPIGFQASCEFPETWTPCTDSCPGDVAASDCAELGVSTAESSRGLDLPTGPTLSAAFRRAYSRTVISLE